MSETKVPEIDEVSKAPDDETLYAMYRGHEYCEDGLRAVYNAGVESLALENAMLKAELARRETADAHYGSVPFGEMAKVKSERDRAVEMLTAPLDATEEKDVAGG